MRTPNPSVGSGGFTLIEMAIVLLIVLILMGGLVATFSGQVEVENRRQTEETLANIQEALLGFAVSQQRLPCPAAPGTTGTESPSTGTGVCTNPTNGFVPGTTLGIGPNDSQGYVVDAWGQRIRYAVTVKGTLLSLPTCPATTTNTYTTNNGMRSATMACLVANNTDYLSVCGRLNGTACATNYTLTDNAVAVVFSTGGNWAQTASTDEAENTGGNGNIFVSHEPTVASGTTVVFDDQVIWLSPYVLYSRMIAAGQLP